MRWPGYGGSATVVIPVAPGAWPPPAAAVVVAGVRFEPKRELHVTVVGKALGARLRERCDEGEVAAAFAAQDWSFQRTRCLLHLRRVVDGATEQSLIERIAQPAMAMFHAVLSRLLGEALPVPPPHVTLYVAGTDEGIGLPDEAALARWIVGEIRLP